MKTVKFKLKDSKKDIRALIILGVFLLLIFLVVPYFLNNRGEETLGAELSAPETNFEEPEENKAKQTNNIETNFEELEKCNVDFEESIDVVWEGEIVNFMSSGSCYAVRKIPAEDSYPYEHPRFMVCLPGTDYTGYFYEGRVKIRGKWTGMTLMYANTFFRGKCAPYVEVEEIEEINPVKSVDTDWNNQTRIINGNIFYRDENLEETQITFKNLDVGAILSPDKEKIAFLRQTTNNPTIECPEHPDFGGNSWHEIWLYDLITQEETLLTSAEDTCYGYIEKLVFSLDEKKIYFKHSKWVTSSAIEVVDIATKKVNFITGGNTLEVIQEGEYRGNLLVSKHKYHPAPNYGAYSASCIISPEGEEIKILD